MSEIRIKMTKAECATKVEDWDSAQQWQRDERDARVVFYCQEYTQRALARLLVKLEMRAGIEGPDGWEECLDHDGAARVELARIRPTSPNPSDGSENPIVMNGWVCKTCATWNSDEKERRTTCRRCAGPRVVEANVSHAPSPPHEPCSRCDGTGLLGVDPCKRCDGRGFTS